jgi:CBS domain-containing protein
MRCQDIARRPLEFCRENETVEAAARKMRDANIGFLPVCGTGGRVVGVVTDRDLALRVCAENLAPGQTRIGDVMTREVVSCLPGDDLRRAEQLMIEAGKARILVAEEDGRAVGVISLSDIATFDRPFAAETLQGVSAREVRGH